MFRAQWDVLWYLRDKKTESSADSEAWPESFRGSRDYWNSVIFFPLKSCSELGQWMSAGAEESLVINERPASLRQIFEKYFLRVSRHRG